ncbi:MAG: DUF2079 domain-containing protein [Actinomycetota bacterium]
MTDSSLLDDATTASERDTESVSDGASALDDHAPTDDRSWRDRLRPPTWGEAAVGTAIVVYTIYFTSRSLDIHHALGTASYDSALYDQGMWLLSRFDAPFVTLMGRNLFGDHTSFILLFLVPLYWIAPGAWIMFFSQSFAIALGAVPVFLYGRSRLGSEWMACVGAGVYLLHPAIGWTNLENFHPDAFLGVTVGFAIYAALERKWRLYAVAVVLSLLVKEDVALVIVPLGIWVALRRNWRIGLITVLGAVWFMAVAMFLVMRSLIGVPTRNSWRIPFGGPTGVIDTAVTNPTQLADYLRSDERPWYLWQMTAPFAFLFARLPDVALISALVMFTNILSTYWYQYQVEYHYSLIAVPALAIGTMYAIGVLRDRWTTRGVNVPVRAIAVGALAVASVTTAYLWSPTPWSRDPGWIPDPASEFAESARDIIAGIPDDASVAAHYRITPHVAYREEIYQFPVPFRVVLYGPDISWENSRLGSRAEGVDYVVLPTSRDEQLIADWASVSPAFVEVEANQYWVLYERDRSVPLPPGGPDIEPVPR